MPKGIYGRNTADAVLARRQEIGALLTGTNLNLGEIARRVNVTRQAVQQIHQKYFSELQRPPRPEPKLPRRSLKRQFLQILRASGATWCYGCNCVKCLEEDFSPAARERNGRLCRKCSSARMAKQYRDNPRVKAYYDRYKIEHPEVQKRASERWRRKNAPVINLTRRYRRLDKKAPLLADAVRHGEMTLDEAWSKFSGAAWTRVRADVDGFVAAIELRFNADERAEIARLLMAGEGVNAA